MEKEVTGGGYSWWKGDAKMEISWDLKYENGATLPCVWLWKYHIERVKLEF